MSAPEAFPMPEPIHLTMPPPLSVADGIDPDELRHVATYRPKRREWMQAKRDRQVAHSALRIALERAELAERARADLAKQLQDAQKAYEGAKALEDEARQHWRGTAAAVDNLHAELLAIVNGEDQ